MTSHGFDIIATNESLDVRRDPKSSSRDRFGGAAIVGGAMVLGLALLVFLPGKHGDPPMWSDLSTKPISSSDFLFPFTLLSVITLFMGWLGLRWSLAAWPSDDALHCNTTVFAISRARWLDRSNTLVASTYALSQISQLRYGAIATANGSTIYGLRFRIDGKKQKLLAGLEAPEASVILSALKKLGADVPDDPKLQKKITAAREMRGEDTSWMDRTWMDPS